LETKPLKGATNTLDYIVRAHFLASVNIPNYKKEA